MKIFLAFFLQNIYFSYLCTKFLMDIKMKQAKYTFFFTHLQRRTDLSEVNHNNVIRNVRAEAITASMS